jgi:hypothetical protein
MTAAKTGRLTRTNRRQPLFLRTPNLAIFLPVVTHRRYSGRMAIIGKRNTLSIVRAAAPGLYLDGGELGEILLPGRYIPADLKPKDKLDVFVYRDSEDRLVATTETPLAMVGEFAYLKVISVNQNIGAFLDWGLAKDLLLPFREQESPFMPEIG